MADNRVIPIDSYYARQGAVHLDGTPIFQTPEDRRNEIEVAQLCAAAWACSIRPFGALSAVDWFAEQHGRMIGVLELKCRTHPVDRYPTVFLNFRKCIALWLASTGSGVPPVFVVRFTDDIRWLPLSEIADPRPRIAGCSRVVKSHNDIEPIIDVRVKAMHGLEWNPAGIPG